MSSKYDDLEKLADLKNKGIITEEEFNIKKLEILDGARQEANKESFPQTKDKPQQKIDQVSTYYSSSNKPPVEQNFNFESFSKDLEKPLQNMSPAFKKFIWAFIILIILCIPIALIKVCENSLNETQQNNITHSNAPGDSNKDNPILPNEENEFIYQMGAFETAYNKASNDINKSDVFNQARSYEQQYFGNKGNTITNWVGYINTISTNKGGSKLFLTVKITNKGTEILFRDGHELFGGINPTSTTYNQARGFKEGECVIFSGNLNLEEKSHTEFGAMLQPEYYIHLTNLSKCTN